MSSCETPKSTASTLAWAGSKSVAKKKAANKQQATGLYSIMYCSDFQPACRGTLVCREWSVGGPQKYYE